MNSDLDSLIILQWNCNGIKAHLDELRKHVIENNYNYAVICVEESFLKPEKRFSFPGYRIVRQDRLDGAKGGLLTLIRDDIVYTEESLCSPSDIECVVVKIKTQSHNLRIVNMYIATGKIVDIDKLSKMFIDNTIIVGDLNAKSRL